MNVDERYYTKEERINFSRDILKQIQDLNLKLSYPAIKKLLQKLSEYNNSGHREIINIPFPEVDRRIKGILAIHRKEEPYIMLVHEKF